MVRQQATRLMRRVSSVFTALVLGLGLVAPYLNVATVHAAGIESIWPSTATPAHADAADSGSVEVGVKFTAAVSGTATGVRFYKGATNTGTHVGHLWSSTGTQLAAITFSGETASGWQAANFTTPVLLTVGVTYIVSYLAPVGQYAVDSSPSDPGNLSTAVINGTGDLTALASGATGGNGVFTYTSSPSGAFPSSSFNNSNYWVDVLFNPGGTPPPATTIYNAGYVPALPDGGDASPVSLGVQFQSQTAGYISGIRFYKATTNTGTHVGSLWTAKHTLLAQATFSNETASGWQDVRFSDMVPIAANTTYTASYFAPQGHYSFTSNGLAGGITNAPLVALPGSSTPGGNGVYSYGISPEVPITATTGSDYAVDVDFSLTYVAPTGAQPTPRAGTVGTGAVLVLTDPANHFSDNYCGALLQTKGVACASTDAGNLTAASVLAPYHTVILADGAALTSAQLTLVTNWTNSGGNFIAMRPAANLNTLLGIGARSNILPDAYLKIDTTQAPGLGIDGQTLQYHGVADEHALNVGTRVVATLYSDVSTATTFPAVTTRTVGTGTASAWMFDLARSVVYTREGNPGLAGQAPASVGFDGNPRVSDRFALGYLDVAKAAVPQADLQITLLANQIETVNFPSPIKWAFPSYKVNANHPNGLLKAAFVLTGDDHNSNSQTVNRFAGETAASPAGCTTVAWTCIRSTSYAYAGAFSDATAKPYTDAGFEVSPHIADNGACAANWSTQATLDTIFSTANNAWQAAYPTISAAHPPITERFHCYGVWRDYATVAKEEFVHGMKADANSSCWPNSLLNVGQCLFTGSGLPQNLADADGTLTGVNQFATQATDENPSTVAQTALDGLVTNATGANGYYGYFTVLAHLDNLAISNQTEASVLAVAANRDVPVISAAQAQTFWAGRNATTVSNPTYATSTVTFSVGTPVANLLLLQPTKYGTKTVATIKRGATTIAYGTQAINGVSYAVFPASAAGSYVVTYN